MSKPELEAALRNLTLGGLSYLASTRSTNDEALAWAASGAQDLSLVVADEQTSGRGREGRRWFTPPGAGLAFSLVLRPGEAMREQTGRFSGLGALALLMALRRRGLEAQIKWPNDVLIRRRKVAGILVETVWMGTEVESLVLGMGVNVSPAALPPADQLNFPATCVETELGAKVPRYELLRDVLEELIGLRAELASDGFIEAWQDALAFRNETVHIWQGGGQPFSAVLLGLDSDGSLRVRSPGGEERSIHFGEVHLRPG
ncbi:MAG TPA: biotin--[acetyl-CoA-carboxylase] ligase [Anaerolineales bacterium]|jgi:BirA family biotin operon repressor/biotin-[acetyl-CoA-carboxylase] ligase